jgi:predicted RNA binding protein YcfA (HicA-like mRNA interferase family)
MNSREIAVRLLREGWREVKTSGGSHRKFKKAGVGHVTVPHPRRDFPVGTLRSIHRQAGWTWPPVSPP